MDRELALTVAAGVMSAVVRARLLPVRLILLIGGVAVGVLAAVLGSALDVPVTVVVLLVVVAALALIAGAGVWAFEWVLRRLIRFIAPPRAVPTEVSEGLERAGIPAGPITAFRFLRQARRNPEGMRGEVLAMIERVRDLPELIDSVAPEGGSRRGDERDAQPEGRG